MYLIAECSEHRGDPPTGEEARGRRLYGAPHQHHVRPGYLPYGYPPISHAPVCQIMTSTLTNQPAPVTLGGKGDSYIIYLDIVDVLSLWVGGERFVVGHRRATCIHLLDNHHQETERGGRKLLSASPSKLPCCDATSVCVHVQFPGMLQ